MAFLIAPTIILTCSIGVDEADAMATFLCLSNSFISKSDFWLMIKELDLEFFISFALLDVLEPITSNKSESVAFIFLILVKGIVHNVFLIIILGYFSFKISDASLNNFSLNCE